MSNRPWAHSKWKNNHDNNKECQKVELVIEAESDEKMWNGHADKSAEQERLFAKFANYKHNQ